MKNLYYILNFLMVCIGFLACKHQPDPVYNAPQTDLPPNSLRYSSSSIRLVAGTAYTSEIPTLIGTAPFSFRLASIPDHYGQITVLADGRVQFGAGLAPGTYQITIVVSNAAGSKSFPNVLQIEVSPNAIAPQTLKYESDTFQLEASDTLRSGIPTTNATLPITYRITDIGYTGKIEIVDQGQIRVLGTLPIGLYPISILAKNEAGEKQFDQVVFIRVKPKAASRLTYTPAQFSTYTLRADSSNRPTVEGSGPFTFSLLGTVPSGISINAQGVITANDQVAVGQYVLSVQVVNAAATTTFSNIFTVNVQAAPQAPSNLIYSTDSIRIVEGNTAASVQPNIAGTSPIKYSLRTQPDAGNGIQINSQTGIIQVQSSVAPGKYRISVEASNMVDTIDFQQVFSVIVLAAEIPSALNYTPNSSTTFEGTTIQSALPSVQGSAPFQYQIHSITPNTSGINIGNNGVIGVAGNVPVGNYQVSVQVQNKAGSVVFPNAWTVEVQAAPITFDQNIRPVIVSQCSNCHTGGGQTNYTIKFNTQNDIALILDRIQRNESDRGFMPKNGTKMSTSQINLFQQWQNEGFK